MLKSAGSSQCSLPIPELSYHHGDFQVPNLHGAGNWSATSFGVSYWFVCSSDALRSCPLYLLRAVKIMILVVFTSSSPFCCTSICSCWCLASNGTCLPSVLWSFAHNLEPFLTSFVDLIDDQHSLVYLLAKLEGTIIQQIANLALICRPWRYYSSHKLNAAFSLRSTAQEIPVVTAV